MTQLTHYTSNFTKKQFPITIVCDNISNAPNIGSLFRTADAFGVEQLIFCGNDIPMGRKMTKTARATEKVVSFKIEENTLEVVSSLKQKGFQIIALEITSNSIPLHTFNYSDQSPIALVIGDENFGVSEEILKKCDHILHIEMFGQNSSMNVVQATSVALYELTKQIM
ncbi:TrmH family RNA methyltransferase [Mangrovimonas sp. DI 80]|uniref:TrmH family RNA methyltransferase n=1 Tax=Mangrovimonas sp. DI 80 TaxID=1779330 RepID=UPI000977621F|nr:TrmH family RNA methyltransferase [Mangrovimonas sp. DI 80]OMP30806.1 RNA methyltransferase [Mangrovimonas sp. DI 80]